MENIYQTGLVMWYGVYKPVRVGYMGYGVYTSDRADYGV